jgi:O-antigen/teichoic acid export membrane protein
MPRSVLHNTSILTVSNILSPLASVALVLAIARLRGPEELGAYSIAMAVFVVAEGLAALGLGVIATREVARQPEAAGQYFVASCVVSAAVITPLLLVAVPLLLEWRGGASVAATATGILALATLPSVITGIGSATFLGLERVADLVAIDLGEKCSRAMLGGLLVYAGFGVVALAWLVLGLRVVAAAAYVLRLRRGGVRLPRTIDRGLCRQLLAHMPVTGTIPLVNALYSRLDVFMLGWLGSLEAVGLYGAALRLTDVARTFPSAFGRALYPRLARLAVGPTAGLMAATRAAARQVLVATGAVALVLVGLGRVAVPLLLGAQFTPAVGVLGIIAWAIVPYALSCVLSTALFATNHQAADMRVNLVCLAIAPVLHYVLIPRFGVAGAAYAMCASALLYASLQHRFVGTLVAPPRLGGVLARLFIALAVAGGLPSLLVPALNPFLATLLSLGVFAILCVVTGLITREDRTGVAAALGAGLARRQPRHAA